MGFLSALGSVTDLVGGALSSSTGKSLLQSVVNNYYNKKAASKQYDYTKSLIDYENDYNNPSEIRARLEAAGYNPNLALNGVNVTSATGSAPTVKPSQLDLLSAYNLDQQNQLLQAQKRLTNENALLSIANRYIAGQKVSEARAKSTMALYNADYAQAEHELWRKTGKIPQSYYRPDWAAELTGVIKGVLSDNL